MKTIYMIKNDWDDQTLTTSGTWCNDGRDMTEDRAVAERMLRDYQDAHPYDAGRVQLDSYELDENA